MDLAEKTTKIAGEHNQKEIIQLQAKLLMKLIRGVQEPLVILLLLV